ncbi:three-Cys-motif partner protein TcmP [Treponema denticola]|uniref:Three-Cys-motif partner protein TcmP n=1 Tax=Treponema denticola TaxID=158 RepID=A0A9Q9BKX7_TREDN|nr:three-Cys-motif partner protein TcmP [Treponema denticola]UTC91195.1 three-Cys-motif partner protein TcmP [Treponema denticola]UTC99452.1 three-Cys-motif partner protein TcmP [Treponema denticola]
MTKKLDPKKNLLSHSEAKVKFYKTYLEKYLRILCSSEYIKNINIYDLFCGRGIYENGGKGSPIAAFEAIESCFIDENKKINTDITLIVNDIAKENVDAVKEYIDKHTHNYCSVRYFNVDIQDMFITVKNEVNKTKNNTRNIIFIDPYGYKDIKKDLLLSLMENKKTEIILFLPISHMYRFTKTALQHEENAQYEALRQFIDGFFPENHKIRTEKIYIMDYIKCISDALRFNNQFYTTSYYIERDQSNYFALFFLSSHIFGFEKILEVKWYLDEDNGKGFKIQDSQGDLFADCVSEEIKTNNAKNLEDILLAALAQPKTNNELYKITLKNEYLPKHTTEILIKWQDTKSNFKVVDIKTGKPARKRAFYISYDHYKSSAKVNFIIEKI